MKKLVVMLGLALPVAPAFADEGDSIDALYMKHCKSCHGDTGKGDTKLGIKHKVDDMTDPKWQARHSDEKIKKAIVEGVPKTKMKGFKDKLTSAQVDSMVQFVRAMKP